MLSVTRIPQAPSPGSLSETVPLSVHSAARSGWTLGNAAVFCTSRSKLSRPGSMAMIFASGNRWAKYAVDRPL